jgi:DHA2 family multidrug resistance protein
MMLDRGNTEDWLQSNFIVALAIISIVGIVAFVARSYRNPNAILQIDLLRDRNLATATFMIMAFGVGMLSTIALQPLFLEHMLGYPAATAGLVMAPRGIAVAVGMTLVATLITRVQPRWLVLIGLTLAAAGSYAMTWYNLDIDTAWIIGPGIVQGIGMGMIFVPLSTLAYQTLPKEASDQAASIFNLARTVGGSVGIAIAATVLTRASQANWQTLGAGVNPSNPALGAWLDATGASLSDPSTTQLLGLEVFRQSTLLGFIEAFGFVTLAFLLLIPLVLVLKRTTSASQFGISSSAKPDKA